MKGDLQHLKREVTFPKIWIKREQAVAREGFSIFSPFQSKKKEGKYGMNVQSLLMSRATTFKCMVLLVWLIKYCFKRYLWKKFVDSS